MTIRSETKATCPECGASVTWAGKLGTISTGCTHATLIAGPGATKNFTQHFSERVVIQ